MRTLLRRSVSAGNQQGWTDTYLDGVTLDLGRGTDQQIHLADPSVALRHAQIIIGDQVLLRSHGTHDVVVNGKAVRSAALKVGDHVQLGHQRLTVLEPPDASVTLALQLETPPEQAPQAIDASRFRMRLADVPWLRQRPAAWIAFFVLLVLFLGLPMLAAQSPGLREAVRESPLPDDGTWLAGPLHSAHQFIGDDCQACHKTTFERVENEACIACHEDTARHVDPARHHMPALENRRCASCHHEHNESPSLVIDEQPFCSACHAELSASIRTDLKDVRDFGAAHPPFRIAVAYHDAASGTWRQSMRVDVDGNLRDRNNLVFSHVLHMDRKGVKNELGQQEVLVCGDCHKAGRDGARIETGDMEQACARCHGLSFDATAPSRTVPHGKPGEVLASLREFYSQRFVDNVQAGAAPTRRPGEVQAGRLQSEGVAWVNAEVGRAAKDLFERRACVTCHEVKAGRDGKGRPAWEVTPVHLNAHWFPSAHFDHGKHKSMVCGDCHDAGKSKEASDVLMPPIETCRNCHDGGERGGEGIASGCVSCHRFHLPQAGKFGGVHPGVHAGAPLPVRAAARATGEPAPSSSDGKP